MPADSSVRLRAAIVAAVGELRAADLRAAVDELMASYRSGARPASPVLSTPVKVGAYAAYRMPATFGAVGAALRQLRARSPGWLPISHVDFGAGTGAAAWAVADVWPTVRRMTLLEQARPARELGARIMAGADSLVLRSAPWRHWQLGDGGEPAADLATVAYVLGELDEAQRTQIIDLAAARARTVVVVEAGTPAGYRRILAARARLIGAGLTVLAPCPHQLQCPLAGRNDWCHFAVRVDRSPLHRRLKDGERSFEDEKFSWVAATHAPDPPDQPGDRVIRRPQRRKGLVSLALCTVAGGAEERVISKRQGATYRAATDVGWGDLWPPAWQSQGRPPANWAGRPN